MRRKSEVFRSGDRKQIWSGLFFLLLGTGTLWQLPPDIGTPATVGPGFFPMLLGICLILLGGASMVAGCRSRMAVRAEPIPVRAVLSVLAGVWVFAALINTAGLALSLLCLLLPSCMERLKRAPLEIVAIYVVLLGMTWFIFIHVIQLPMKVFWWN
jgi:Tripartite tricarboxylate transporter TctB family